MRKLRIGSGAGYAGDRLEPALELIEKGNLDYISFECLAERTIAIAQMEKLKDPAKGYNALLEYRMDKVIPLAQKHGVKIITNMGAANPQAAIEVCAEIAERHGNTGLKIAAVFGDDVLDLMADYQNTELWETKRPLSELEGEIISANAYVGVDGILEALKSDADIIITGRVADPAIFMAPIIHEFDWATDDWNLLGIGTAVGHLLECGGQVTGGYYAEPGKKDVENLALLGFPIVEINEVGEFFVTKVEGSGGRITTAVSPQTGDHFFLVLPYSNTLCMNAFLAELSLAYADQQIILICDNAPWHRSKALIIPENILIVHIPPYTPEMNPIEQVWRELRKPFANKVFSSLDKVIDHLCTSICSLSNDLIYSIVHRKWLVV